MPKPKSATELKKALFNYLKDNSFRYLLLNNPDKPTYIGELVGTPGYADYTMTDEDVSRFFFLSPCVNKDPKTNTYDMETGKIPFPKSYWDNDIAFDEAIKKIQQGYSFLLLSYSSSDKIRYDEYDEKEGKEVPQLFVRGQFQLDPITLELNYYPFSLIQKTSQDYPVRPKIENVPVSSEMMDAPHVAMRDFLNAINPYSKNDDSKGLYNDDYAAYKNISESLLKDQNVCKQFFDLGSNGMPAHNFVAVNPLLRYSAYEYRQNIFDMVTKAVISKQTTTLDIAENFAKKMRVSNAVSYCDVARKNPDLNIRAMKLGNEMVEQADILYTQLNKLNYNTVFRSPQFGYMLESLKAVRDGTAKNTLELDTQLKKLEQDTQKYMDAKDSEPFTTEKGVRGSADGQARYNLAYLIHDYAFTARRGLRGVLPLVSLELDCRYSAKEYNDFFPNQSTRNFRTEYGKMKNIPLEQKLSSPLENKPLPSKANPNAKESKAVSPYLVSFQKYNPAVRKTANGKNFDFELPQGKELFPGDFCEQNRVLKNYLDFLAKNYVRHEMMKADSPWRDPQQSRLILEEKYLEMRYGAVRDTFISKLLDEQNALGDELTLVLPSEKEARQMWADSAAEVQRMVETYNYRNNVDMKAEEANNSARRESVSKDSPDEKKAAFAKPDAHHYMVRKAGGAMSEKDGYEVFDPDSDRVVKEFDELYDAENWLKEHSGKEIKQADNESSDSFDDEKDNPITMNDKNSKIGDAEENPILMNDKDNEIGEKEKNPVLMNDKDIKIEENENSNHISVNNNITSDFKNEAEKFVARTIFIEHYPQDTIGIKLIDNKNTVAEAIQSMPIEYIRNNFREEFERVSGPNKLVDTFAAALQSCGRDGGLQLDTEDKIQIFLDCHQVVALEEKVAFCAEKPNNPRAQFYLRNLQKVASAASNPTRKEIMDETVIDSKKCSFKFAFPKTHIGSIKEMLNDRINKALQHTKLDMKQPDDLSLDKSNLIEDSEPQSFIKGLS